VRLLQVAYVQDEVVDPDRWLGLFGCRRGIAVWLDMVSSSF
jgi:hypothetical protein